MDRLSSEDLAVWHACKTLGMVVTRHVIGDITARTGLSGADYGVIYRLDDHGGALGQQALTESMQLTKGAMSHQLTRMTERGLVRREKTSTGTTVVLTDHGRTALRQARPIHADAVHRHLLDRLTAQDRETLVRIATLLADQPATATPSYPEAS